MSALVVQHSAILDSPPPYERVTKAYDELNRSRPSGKAPEGLLPELETLRSTARATSEALDYYEAQLTQLDQTAPALIAGAQNVNPSQRLVRNAIQQVSATITEATKRSRQLERIGDIAGASDLNNVVFKTTGHTVQEWASFAQAVTNRPFDKKERAAAERNALDNSSRAVLFAASMVPGLEPLGLIEDYIAHTQRDGDNSTWQPSKFTIATSVPIMGTLGGGKFFRALRAFRGAIRGADEVRDVVRAGEKAAELMAETERTVTRVAVPESETAVRGSTLPGTPSTTSPNLMSRDAFREGGYTFFHRVFRTHFQSNREPMIISTGDMLLAYEWKPGHTNFMDGITVREGLTTSEAYARFKEVASKFRVDQAFQEGGIPVPKK